ncbi:TPA: hypothetical protein ACH3X2_000847 [Trebouxia sp. C0005]
MVSVSGAAGHKAASQSGQSSANSIDQYTRMAAQRQGGLGQIVQPGSTSSRLQGGWESAQAYSRPGPPQVNAGFMPGTQPVWPPGSLQYMQPQVYMYPGLPGNPPGFFPPQSLHGAQRPVQQMMPQVGMMIPGQQYSGINPMYPFGMGPSPTPEQWMQARHRPQAAMFQGVRPMGWGGMPFQSLPNDPRWQANPKPVAASLQPRRPDRLSQQQPPPPPPPPRTASGQQLASLDRHMSQPVQRPTPSDPQTASRSNSSPAIPHAPPQAEQQAEPRTEQPEHSDQQAAAGAHPVVGKVPCAFFLKTGTCAYGDKCKFEHPWDKLPIVRFNSMGLPLRQGQPECAYYLRHGRCGFGPSCKFHHPEPGTAGAPAATADSETVTSTEQAPTSTPLPDAAVAHSHSGQQQGATGTVSPQTADTAQADMPPASISVQAQQPQSFVMAQPQFAMPASAHPQYSSTTYPQMPQPQAGFGQGPQIPQMQYVTTASPLFPQAQYASASTPQQQVPLASSAALQPAALAFQQAYPTTAVAPTPVPTAALGSPQQPQSAEVAEQAQPQPSGSAPVAQPQLQFQAQTAPGPPPPYAAVVPQHYQLPLRAASAPVGTSGSLQQQHQQGPIATVPVGVVSTQQGHVAASVPVVQAQLQHFVLGPASGVTAAPSAWPEPQLQQQQQQQQLPQQQPAPLQVLQQQSQVLQPAQQQLQQQPPLFVPGQTMLSAQQLVAANQMSPGQASVPAQQVMFTQALPQTVPMLLSLSAAMTQPVQLVPTQGVTQAPPVPGLTPLEHVPTQAGSPPKKAEDSLLDDMSAGLPSLTGNPGSDVLKPLSPFDSESSSQPYVATPAPSEASLATASTTSTSTSFTLKSDTTIDIDTAKAIEAVRNSLGAKDGAGLTLDQLTKRAQAKES